MSNQNSNFRRQKEKMEIEAGYENPYMFFKPDRAKLSEGEQKLFELPWKAYLYVVMDRMIINAPDLDMAEGLRATRLDILKELTPGEKGALMTYIEWQTQRIINKSIKNERS